MKFFALLFLCMALYGFVSGKVGGGLLALGMAGFVVYGTRQLNKRDAEYYADPANAKAEPDTLEVLDRQGSECTRSKF